MSYIINNWDNTPLTTVEDGTLNQTLDIKLVGKNYAGYGEIQNETFLHMLQHFASDESKQPSKAIAGQLWYDVSSKKIRLFTGDIDSTTQLKIWKSLNGAEYSATAPLYATPGDLWFDTDKDQLNVKLENDWLVVGPQNAGTGTTQMVSRDVIGTDQAKYGIIAATVSDKVTFIISEDNFTLDLTKVDSIIDGFNTDTTKQIKRGINLAYSDRTTGVGTTGSYKFVGTASNADYLGGLPASDYIRSTNTTFEDLVTFPKTGFTVGGTFRDLAVFIEQGTEPIIQANGPRISFRIRDGINYKTPVVMNATGVIPGVSTTFNLGSLSNKWSTVYATTFSGTATVSEKLKIGNSELPGTMLPTPNTLAVRDNNGIITAASFSGNATSATKLATERKINLVNFDGTADITIFDATKLPLLGGTLTGALVLPTETAVSGTNTAYPSSDQHAATKKYVDTKFGVNGLLGIAQGGTNASTTADARTNLEVPRIDGTGVTSGTTWNINIAPTLGPNLVTAADAAISGSSGSLTTATVIIVPNDSTVGGNIPSGAGYDDVSSLTPVTVATGTKSFTVNKIGAYKVNQRIQVSYSATPTQIYMRGAITNIDEGAKIITILADSVLGSGTLLTGWNFSGLGDTWREGSTITFPTVISPATPPLTGTVIVTEIQLNSPSIGQTTLAVTHPAQIVAGVTTTIQAADSGNGQGGNAATATKSRNIAGGSRGTMYYQTAADITNALPIGPANYILSSTGQVPEWKNLNSVNAASSSRVLVKNKETDAGLFYPMFTLGSIVSPGGENREAYIDQDVLTYDTQNNQLILGTDGDYGSVVADLVGDLYAHNGNRVVTVGTGGLNSTFSGVAEKANSLFTARTFSITGDVETDAPVSFNGTGNVELTVSLKSGLTIDLGSGTSGNYVSELAAGSHITLRQGLNAYDPNDTNAVTINVTATEANTAGAIVSRDDDGNFSANIISATQFDGQATSAQYADLAEKYLADAEYAPGTVVCVGGEKEITAGTFGKRALGVVSTQPAFMMNKDLEGGTYVALKGRVPCKVVGPVTKGDELVAGPDGCAMVLVSSITHGAKVFGLALETNSDSEVKVIEVVVL
jgi:hypothetical protein